MRARAPHELVSVLSGSADATAATKSCAPIGKSNIPVRILKNSGESRCTTVGSKAQRSRRNHVRRRPPDLRPSPSSTANSLEVNFRRDPSIYDGQFANNGWLQELPKPMTKLTWDNAVLVGPKMAQRDGLRTEDMVSSNSTAGR